MKEIKFRAINNITKKWIYSNGYYFDGTNYWFITPNIDCPAIGFANHHIVLKNTISQYTGLKDKNNIEIYEGDIIIYLDVDDFKDRIGVVEFEDLTDVPDWLFWSKKEVIGNIYENPELLE